MESRTDYYTFIKDKLKTYREPEAGIFNFLPERLDQIKEIEKETYTYRSGKFNEEEVLKGDFEEMKLFDPIYRLGHQNRLYLEIGGGDARFALQMMRQGYKIVESDISSGSVRKARQFAEKLGVADNNYFMVLDAENIPFKDNSFDGVFMVAALHHLSDYHRALGEINRVLKPGGQALILREPAAWFHYVFWPVIVSLRWLVRKIGRKEPKSKADDITMGFSKRKLMKIFELHDFTEIVIKPIDYTRKYYIYSLFLLNRLFRENYRPNQGFENFLRRLDGYIAKIPILNLLPWDWDCHMKKSEHI